MHLSDLQRDLLIEAFNMGVGRAARSLNELLGQHYELEISVPVMEFLRTSEVRERLSQRVMVGSVLEHFSGGFNGHALLLYSRGDSRAWVRFLLDESTMDLSPDVEGEAMCEIGNILLNGCLSAMGDFLAFEFQTELPFHSAGLPSELAAGDGWVLYLRADFASKDYALSGDIVLCLSQQEAHRLVTCLEEFVIANSLAG